MSGTTQGIPAQRRAVGVALGLGLAALVWWAPRPASLTPEAWSVASISVLMAVWWVADVLPRAVTSLVPLVAFPLTGAMSMGDTAPSYGHPLLFLMLGGFVMGAGMEQVGLHERLTALLLRPAWVRRGPRRVLGALMLVTAGMSGLVSNTATILMMLPLAFAMARVGARPGEDARGAFVLALAYAASIGGMTTLVGTPPNAVLAGMVPDLIGSEVGFAQWLWIGVPAAGLLLPVAWWSVAVNTYALPDRFTSPVPAPDMPAAHAAERWVIGVVGMALVAWLTRSDKVLGDLTLHGWESWVDGKGYELDAMVALLAAMALFAVPGVRGPDGHRTVLLSWSETERAIPWSVLLLLGGGFALAKAIVATGLTEWLASGISGLEGVPLAGKVLVVCLVMTFVTELTSNTATAQIALPILAQAAVVSGVAPMMWLVPATLSASCAFMMPVATAPNAIAAEAGGVSGREMARAGLQLNLLGAAVITLLTMVWVPWVFPS